jgi:hypothetical protein
MRISYEGDLDAAQAYLGKAQQELGRLRTRMESQGVEQGRFQHALADDAYCYGLILPGGIEHLHIVTAPGVEPTSALELRTIPDFLSGISASHLIEPDPVTGAFVMSSFYPTPDCAALHPDELPDGAWATARLPRFAVEYDSNFSEFDHPGRMFTPAQYHFLKPSMYSGSMKKVIQALLGFGRQNTDADGNDSSIYGDVIADSEILTDAVDAERELTAYESSVKEDGLQIKYDYRSFRTHGICFDTENHLWLVEISMNRGGIAMRLPLHDATTEADFRDALDVLGDSDALTMLDELGGFPTGESFPGTNTQLEAFIRAGKIVRFLPKTETDRFYWYAPYSTAMGWAFNKSGTEAHNTAYYFADDDRQRGVHFSINLNFGAPANKVARTPDPTLIAIFEALRSKPEFADLVDAAIYKLSYMEDADYAAAMLLEGGEATLRYVDALILEPEVAATASLAKCSEGNLYWPSKIQPEIKFPDYTLNACISHDLRPGWLGRYKPLMYCDTVMHVFFVEDELKYCKLYINPDQISETQVESDDSFDIMWSPIGTFSRKTTYGPFGIPAMFYTNDIDDREELGTQIQFERWNRTDRGFISVIPAMVSLTGPYDWNNNAGPLDPDFPEGGAAEQHKLIIAKFKWFFYKAWWDLTNAHRLAGAICVPLNDRNAMFYAKFAGYGSAAHQYHESAGFLASPYIGHWYRENESLLEMEAQYHVIENENWPYQRYQDIADIGDWVPHGTDWHKAVYGADAMQRVRDQARSTNSTDPALMRLNVFLIAENTNVVQTKDQIKTGTNATYWEPFWFTPSPDDYGLVAVISATANCLGDSKAAVFMPDINSGEVVVSGVPQPNVLKNNVIVNFHGIING